MKVDLLEKIETTSIDDFIKFIKDNKINIFTPNERYFEIFWYIADFQIF